MKLRVYSTHSTLHFYLIKTYVHRWPNGVVEEIDHTQCHLYHQWYILRILWSPVVHVALLDVTLVLQNVVNHAKTCLSLLMFMETLKNNGKNQYRVRKVKLFYLCKVELFVIT